LPLFPGVRLLGGEQFSLSDMIVLLCYEENEHGHRETLAANWGDANDPKATCGASLVVTVGAGGTNVTCGIAHR
jgi:hypothetical protein